MVVFSAILALLIPWNVWSLSSHARPVSGYDEAAERIEALRAKRQAEMNPDCLLQFLTHGRKAQRVVILVHGYTSCPAQFDRLGQQFYELGYNVLIAPLPHHGLANRLNNEQSQLTAKGLTVYADEMVDLAQGLGEQVSMVGLSGGGVTTAWAAQNRSDLDSAVIIAPAFSYRQIPHVLTAPIMNSLLLLPDGFEWWDPNLREDIGPFHAYPRYSKHALAQFMKLGFAIRLKSWTAPPAAHRIVVVTNVNDMSVNNSLTAEVVRQWRALGANVETYEFPSSLGLPHDLIDPEQPGQQVEIVYPTLFALLTREE